MWRPFFNENQDCLLAASIITSAACEICRLIRIYSKQTAFADAAPQIVGYVVAAAVVHLMNARSQDLSYGRTTRGRQSANGLKTCLTALQNMNTGRDIRVQRSIKKIQQLALRWGVVWALPIHSSSSLPQTQVATSDEELYAQAPPDSHGFDLTFPNFYYIDHSNLQDGIDSWGVEQGGWPYQELEDQPLETSRSQSISDLNRQAR
jgi:hypothetical protein